MDCGLDNTSTSIDAATLRLCCRCVDLFSNERTAPQGRAGAAKMITYTHKLLVSSGEIQILCPLLYTFSINKVWSHLK
jgi:hypothetical protein